MGPFCQQLHLGPFWFGWECPASSFSTRAIQARLPNMLLTQNTLRFSERNTFLASRLTTIASYVPPSLFIPFNISAYLPDHGGHMARAPALLPLFFLRARARSTGPAQVGELAEGVAKLAKRCPVNSRRGEQYPGRKMV